MTSHEGVQTKCSDNDGRASASALQLLLIKVLSSILIVDMQNMQNHRLIYCSETQNSVFWSTVGQLGQLETWPSGRALLLSFLSCCHADEFHFYLSTCRPTGTLSSNLFISQ